MFKLFKLFYPYFRPYRWIFWTGFSFMAIMNCMTYLVPWGVGQIWDQVLPHLKEPGGLSRLIQWCGFLIVIALIRAGFIFLMIFCFWTTGTKLVNELRNQLYDKLQRLSFSFYDTARIGDLMSRLTLDLEMIRNFYAYLIEHRTQIYMYLTIITGLLFMTDWKLALVCMAITPIAVFTVLNFSKKARIAVAERQKQAGLLNATVQENITGIRVVKSFAMEDIEIQKFQTQNKVMQEHNLKVAKLQMVLHPFLILCSTFGVLIIIWYGGIRVMNGELTIGNFIAFMSYLAILNWPLWILAPNTNQLRQAEGSAERLFELLNLPETIISPPQGGMILPNLQGRIEFNNVDFGYEDLPILKQINLTIHSGEKVALIGLTGSGKTSLINLIPRFYEPQAGKITIDNIELNQLNLDWWRRQVGLVLQETFLFSATIRDNIAFGRPEATREEIEQAARSAQIHQFIRSLPQGYDTIVGERGVGLSGGQKQRIAIARALLLDPKILILDDSTSSVDVETEQAIQESLRVLMQGRTTILITQRLSTANLADRIVILDCGAIRNQGSHEELMDQDEFYRQLYHIQVLREEQPVESA